MARGKCHNVQTSSADFGTYRVRASEFGGTRYETVHILPSRYHDWCPPYPLLRLQGRRSPFPLVRFLYLSFRLPFMVCLLFTTLRGVGCISISHFRHPSVIYYYLFTIWPCYSGMIRYSCIFTVALRLALLRRCIVLRRLRWAQNLVVPIVLLYLYLVFFSYSCIR